ncbi:predicted protein [Nematostella vectensis]|uniref:G-protein coupled receptors family 1 profile domain-containing protein n=1 Tax=Nematostella vectensis TaxID=45351 RepID=A7SXR7_NEMVE|nr:predicted protein [Nematostella vectensis]|eukprot:XP_001623600.1 predicted protein [Nematostella vectensis]
MESKNLPSFCWPYVDWVEYASDNAVKVMTLYIILLIASIPGSTLNLLILATIWRRSSLQTPSNLFLCNLALSDFIVGVVSLPLAISWKYVEIFGKNKEVLCSVGLTAFALSSVFAGISILTVTAATVDRYLALYLHLSYPAKVTTKRVAVGCLLMWTTSLVTALVVFTGFANFNYLTIVILPLCTQVSAVSFYKIFKVIKHHHTQISSLSAQFQASSTLPNMLRYRRSVMSLVYVQILLIISCLPFTCTMIVYQVKGPSVNVLLAWNIGTFFVYLASSLNPVLYCWRIREVRNAVWDTVRLWASRTRHRLLGIEGAVSDHSGGTTLNNTRGTATVIRVKESRVNTAS